MSFSGLKTALLRARDALVAAQGGITVQDRRDLCAGFQAAVAEVLAIKTAAGVGDVRADSPPRCAWPAAWRRTRPFGPC